MGSKKANLCQIEKVIVLPGRVPDSPPGITPLMLVSRKQLILKGTLQGIGFRPTVYRLATNHGLSGLGY